MNILETIRTDFTACFQKAFGEIEGKKLEMHDYVEYFCYRIVHASNLHVFNAPPRCCKSTVGIAFAAWTLGQDPTSRIMVLAGREDLAEEISRKVREIVRASWFKKAFPGTVISKSKSRKMDFATDAGGGVYAASIHGNFTGRGADLIIVDDPLGIADAANLEKIERVNAIFDNAVLSRLNNPRTGKIVIIMHRLHEDDLSGHVWKQGGWTRTVLPLVAPRTRTFDLGYRKWKRKKGEVLRPEAFSEREIKRLQKRESFQVLWQQNPLGNSFKAVKRGHFGAFSALPEVGVVLSIDPSLGGAGDCSFNVIQVWCRADENYFLIDQWRERCGYLTLRRECLRKIRVHRPVAILVERTGNGAALLDEFDRTRHAMVAIVPDGSKLDRFRQVSGIIRSESVLVKEDAPWRQEFLEELTHFPAAEADDQVDAATQALSWLRDNPGLEKPPARAVYARPGAPLPTDSQGVAQAPGIVARFNSAYRPNAPFVQPRAWAEFGHLRADGSRSDTPDES
jgi:predicted phage terminase large subunit-like protein